MDDEERAEGGERHHDDADAALLLLPESQLHDVDFAAWQTDAGDADQGDDDHYDG